MRIIIFLSLIFLIVNCSSSQIAEREAISKSIDVQGSPKESNQLDQISCNPLDCKFIDYSRLNELDEKLNKEMSLNSGKILIDFKQDRFKIVDEELEDIVAYLREIAKREGRVTFEPLYIRERVNIKDVLTVKDLGATAMDIYSRFRNTFKYMDTKNYNAKVIYHPKTYDILMVFFVHKAYGDICNTIYSNCNEIEYLDDETFDQSLSLALKNSSTDPRPIKVNFRQSEVKLFDATIDMEIMKKLNKSARLFKWLIVTKKTNKKPIKRDRFIGISDALSAINYSIALYDYYKEIIMYAPALNVHADVYYTGKEDGGKIESVVFYK